MRSSFGLLVAVVLCLAVSLSQVFGQHEPGSLDDLIDSVFNTGASSTEGTPTQSKGGQTDGEGDFSLNPTGTGGATGETVGDCECVPYYLCKNNTIIKNGEGLLDIRINDGPCSSYLDVCCKTDDKVVEPITTPKPEKPRLGGCGRRNVDGIGFRIKGDKDGESQFGEFPWMVAILREEPVDGNDGPLNVYQCGGALIHPKVVVTAAHCVSDKAKHKSLKARLGEWDTQRATELFPHQDREVEHVIIHEQFYAGALFNDIAVLILKSPVNITDNVDVLCLPPQDMVFDHSRCVASGWGKDVFGQEGRYQVILKKIELPVVPRDECVEALRKTRLGSHFQLNRSFICAGGEEGKDTCKGDGGSPLVCPLKSDPTRYLHAGIVAWGIGCGENQTPGVYVNVALFREWIEDQLLYHQIDPKYLKY